MYTFPNHYSQLLSAPKCKLLSALKFLRCLIKVSDDKTERLPWSLCLLCSDLILYHSFQIQPLMRAYTVHYQTFSLVMNLQISLISLYVTPVRNQGELVPMNLIKAQLPTLGILPGQLPITVYPMLIA